MKLSNQAGTVTAELAVALPIVGFMLAVIVGIFSMQVQRLQLASDAAAAARAIARGEDQTMAVQLVQKPNRQIQFEDATELVCATISQPIAIAGLPSFNMSEKFCARKAGL